jgi:hypothetical protein
LQTNRRRSIRPPRDDRAAPGGAAGGDRAARRSAAGCDRLALGREPPTVTIGLVDVDQDLDGDPYFDLDGDVDLDAIVDLEI